MLAVIIVVQALCALFFFSDVVADIMDGDHLDDVHMMLETLAAIALCAGVVFLMVELRNVLNRMAEMEIGISAARGDMADLIDAFFAQWQLTGSEREVALMVLKGLDNETIARVRGTASGTVRAQCTSIYAKAGVDGRSQLMSVFMEELLHAGDP